MMTRNEKDAIGVVAAHSSVRPCPTPQQEAVIAAARDPALPAVIVAAGAGCGKTSTLRMAAKVLPESRVRYTAFNRSVVEDARRVMPGSVKCQTMHAIAYGHSRDFIRAKGDRIEGSWRAGDLFRALRDRNHVPICAESQQIRLIAKAVRWFCQSSDAEIGPEHVDKDELTRLLVQHCGRHGLEVPHEPESVAQDFVPCIVDDARRLWAKANDPSHPLPPTHEVTLKRLQLDRVGIPCDALFFDECQDVSPVMLAVVLDSLARGTRVVAVGDPAQSIYGFTGAVDAIPRLRTIPGAVELPLSHSWRFGEAIARTANAMLRASGYDVLLTGRGPDTEPFDPEQPYTVLGRSNFALLEEAVRLERAGVAVRIPDTLASSMIRDMEGAYRLWEEGRSDHPALEGMTWDLAIQFLEILDPDMQRAIQCVQKLGQQTTQWIDAIGGMAGTKGARVYCSTAHSAKGGEWDQVRILDDFELYAKGGKVIRQEAHLAYVAVTRAKRALQNHSWQIDRACRDFGPDRHEPFDGVAGPKIEWHSAKTCGILSDLDGNLHGR